MQQFETDVINPQLEKLLHTSCTHPRKSLPVKYIIYSVLNFLVGGITPLALCTKPPTLPFEETTLPVIILEFVAPLIWLSVGFWLNPFRNLCVGKTNSQLSPS